ncbi:hypothetical protein [Paragemmobacter straminiformis]|uniref:Aspartyl protease n=1 Tax=Paragemmobacter straminiformis TaxID=2045119 RepID=A0A842I583_9RHOB|nr:hypothetical protein [Gemmobacter straminiformis]MBC2834573.1 hypothetical protein [Gemmobacter straminiformis]
MTRAKTILLRAMLGLTVSAPAARADLLAAGQAWREIPFEVVDDKPLLAAKVGDVAGRMMFDTGTPMAVFLNRDALPLPAGTVAGRGTAASGQAIEVRLHEAPALQIGGQPFATAPMAPSGNFGFVEGMFGPDFLGFVGTPAVEGGAFALDYGRKVLTVLRSDGAGALAVPQPAPADVVARLTVALRRGEMPTSGAFIGDMPVVLEFDTGDSGTLYLRAETRARLAEGALLTVSGEAGTLAEVTFGGATFDGIAVHLVEAGGPADKRPWPGSDALRLGAGFLSDHPSLWNFPAGTITFLRAGADFLAPRQASGG